MKVNNKSFQEDIKTHKDKFFNLNFSDPPYQLGTKWEIDKQTGRPIVKGKSKDFMNKWDGLDEKDLDLFFRESFRTLKYGGFLLMFGMDRQLFPLEYYAKLNGFEQQQSLYWFFSSSMPHTSDLSKNIDKKLGAEREIIGKKQHKGNLKKAIKNKIGYLGDNANKNNIKCFGYGEEILTKSKTELGKLWEGYKYSISPTKQTNETMLVFKKPNKYGSPLNDVLSNDKECSPSCLNIDESRIKTNDKWKRKEQYTEAHEGYKRKNRSSYTHKTEGEIHPNGRFPAQTFLSEETAEILDKQGEEISKTCHICKYEEGDYDIYNYSPKVQNFERNFGVKSNKHPTLKPLKLLEHLANYFKLPIEQNVYIPFCGVYSEIIGFYKAGYDLNNIYGCELDNEYIKIGKARLKARIEADKKGQTDEQLKKIIKENKDTSNQSLMEYV